MSFHEGQLFSSWDEFFASFQHYMDSTHQPFVNYSSRLASKANERMKPGSVPYPDNESLKFCLYEFRCTHRGKFKGTGYGLKEVRSFKQGCCARIYASVDKSLEKIVLRSVNDVHNHPVGPHLYTHYPKQKLLSPEQEFAVLQLCKLKVPTKTIRDHVQEDFGKSLKLGDIRNIKARRQKQSCLHKTPPKRLKQSTYDALKSFCSSTPGMSSVPTSSNSAMRVAEGEREVGGKAVIAVCQMTATSVKSDNMRTLADLVASAKAKGSQMVFLPEACDYIADSKQQSIELAETLDGSFITRCKELAVIHRVWLSIGGFHLKTQAADGVSKTMNTHVIIDSDGAVRATYSKAHLFDLSLTGSVHLRESDYVIPGDRIVPPVPTPVGRVGLSICYDMRFPELSLALAQQGAQILTYPSAFTQPTGMAHWENILRCRAIESQCYVVAAAQTGKHNAKRSSYGHAMIVDPWGAVIAQCSEGTGVSVAEIDLEYLKKLRLEMPVWQHRRTDLYGRIDLVKDDLMMSTASPDDLPHYQFGHVTVTPAQVFYRTALCFACVNIKPVLPGHTLVVPLRPAVHMNDLNPAEVTDLFLTVQRVSSVVNQHFGCSSSTVAIQDGPEAGQTIKHVHVHILPRKAGDFAQNDDVYDHLQNHDKGWTENTTFRTEAEMAEEAAELRKYFYPQTKGQVS